MIRNYYFEFANPRADFYLTVGENPAEAKELPSAESPDWTSWRCCQCPHCSLSADTEYCPAALDMADLIEHFSRYSSTERVALHVSIDSRKDSIITDLQTALAFVIPTVVAASCCPYSPMLRLADRLCRPFPDVTDFFFFALSVNLIGYHFGTCDLGFSDDRDMLHSGKKGPSDCHDLILVFEYLLKRAQKASENNANTSALEKVVLMLHGLLYPPERMFTHLRRSLAAS